MIITTVLIISAETFALCVCRAGCTFHQHAESYKRVISCYDDPETPVMMMSQVRHRRCDITSCFS